MSETTPSHYNGAILKNLVVFLKRLEHFAFNRDAERKKNIFTVWKDLLKLDESYGLQERAVVSSPPSASKKVAAIPLRTYYKLTGRRVELSPLAGMQ